MLRLAVGALLPFWCFVSPSLEPASFESLRKTPIVCEYRVNRLRAGPLVRSPGIRPSESAFQIVIFMVP